MNRRQFLTSAAAASFSLAPTGGAASDRPNVILMMADDMGWGDTGFHGNKVIQTPNLDSMAKAGIRFTRFYSGGPCARPRAAPA